MESHLTLSMLVHSKAGVLCTTSESWTVVHGNFAWPRLPGIPFTRPMCPSSSSCGWCCQNSHLWSLLQMCLHVTRLAELPPFQKCPGSHHTVINSSSYRSLASWHQLKQILGHSWLPRVPWRLRLDFLSFFLFFKK